MEMNGELPRSGNLGNLLAVCWFQVIGVERKKCLEAAGGQEASRRMSMTRT